MQAIRKTLGVSVPTGNLVARSKYIHQTYQHTQRGITQLFMSSHVRLTSPPSPRLTAQNGACFMDAKTAEEKGMVCDRCGYKRTCLCSVYICA